MPFSFLNYKLQLNIGCNCFCFLWFSSETNEKKYIKKFSDAIEVLKRLNDIDGLIDLLINTSQRAKQMTTIPLVIWAEDLIEKAIRIKEFFEDATFLAKTKEIVIPILEDALSKPLLVSEEYLLLYPSFFTEENINERLQKALNTLKNA